MVFYRCRRPGSFENRSGDGRSTPPVSSPSTGGGEPFPSTGKGWIGVRPCGMRLISSFVDERTLMKHFVLRSNCFFKIAVATWVKRKIRRRAGAPAAQRRDRLGARAAREVPRPLGRRSVQGLFIFWYSQWLRCKPHLRHCIEPAL
jgi:hypothetical protein